MNTTGFIYKITSPSNKIYIGQSTNIIKRKHDYKNARCKSQCKLFNSIIKYGWIEHKFEIIESIDKSLLNEREIYWISFYNSTISGLNILPGGQLRIFSDESKEKMRQAKLGKKHSEEHNKKIGEKSKGKIMSDDAKEKIRISKLGNTNMLGKKHSEETKEKIKISKLDNEIGYKHSEETKKKMSESNIGNKNWLGKKHSEETKKKMSESQLGNKNKLGKKYGRNPEPVILNSSNRCYLSILGWLPI